jgi:hypothetical protein
MYCLGDKGKMFFSIQFHKFTYNIQKFYVLIYVLSQNYPGWMNSAEVGGIKGLKGKTFIE